MDELNARKKPEKPAVAIRGPASLGFVCLAIVIGGFGGWASFAPLAGAVIVRGVVQVESKRKKIQHLEGGIVRALPVHDGDQVRKGMVLLRLEETRPRAILALIQSGYDSARAIEARLIAERDSKDSILFPIDLTNRSADPEVRKTIIGQMTLFKARRASLDGQAAILHQRILQLNEEIVGLRAQQQSMERQVKVIREELQSLLGLYKRGHTTKRRILQLRRESIRLEGEQGRFIAEIARSKRMIGEASMQIVQLRQTFREKVVAELREIQVRLRELRERRVAAAEVLRRIDIRAPVSGIVVGLRVHTLGAVVKPGETIMEIVPSNQRLLIEARVDPVDIDEVNPGQRAAVKFSAFKARTTPTLDGHVSRISADTLREERSGLSYYVAQIEISKAQIARLNGKRILPGMPAEIMIQTSTRTALRYLVQPILDGMRRAWREQ